MICMVMAMDRNRLIGKDGGLPWHLPSELQYFKSVTMGKPIVMGRNTFESIGRLLPGRCNIVVTRQGHQWGDEWQQQGVKVAEGIEQALEIAAASLASDSTMVDANNTTAVHAGADHPEIAVIGGASLCRDAMPSTEKLYLTVIDHSFEGDTWFDSYDPEEWQLQSSRRDEVDGYSLDYQVLTRTLSENN